MADTRKEFTANNSDPKNPEDLTNYVIINMFYLINSTIFLKFSIQEL